MRKMQKRRAHIYVQFVCHVYNFVDRILDCIKLHAYDNCYYCATSVDTINMQQYEHSHQHSINFQRKSCQIETIEYKWECVTGVKANIRTK